MPARTDRRDPESAVTSGIVKAEREDVDVRPGVAGTTSAIQALLTNAAMISLFDQTTLPAPPSGTTPPVVDWTVFISGWQTPINAVMTDATTVANLFSQFNSTLGVLKTGQRSDVQKGLWAFMKTVNKTVLTSDVALATFGETAQTNLNNLATLLNQAGATSSILSTCKTYITLIDKVRTRAEFLKITLKRLSADILDVVMWAGKETADYVEPEIVRQLRANGTTSFPENATVLTSWTRLNWPSTIVLPASIKSTLPAPL